MPSNAKPLVISASILAGVGIVTALAALALRKYKQAQKDYETSGKASRTTQAPFSANEWRNMRNRTGTTDDVNSDDANGEEPDFEAHQRPVEHPTKGGIAGTPDTIALVMVGLPGRGKTAVAARTARYLSFFHGLECQLFNVGDRRRQGHGYMSPKLYTFDDPEALRQRKRFSDDTLNELKLFLLTPGRTAIFDASNITAQRRLEVYSEIKKLGKVDVIFVELISSETMVHESEMAKLDAAGAAGHEPTADFLQRVEQYKAVYEPIAGGPDDDDHEHNFSYIKCIDHGKQVIMNKIDGYMPGRIAQFITNCCHCHWTHEKRLFLSRHGQSEYNQLGRIGGDSGLTDMGERYAFALADFADRVICKDPADPAKPVPARLWTSTLRRTRATARHIASAPIMVDGYPWVQMKPRVWSNLDEIYAGACDGFTYPEVEERFPKEAALRKKDKLSYRYPRGESYLDVIARLEPLVQEIERHRESLLIVGHQGVLRMIFAFYAGIDLADAPHQELNLNHVTAMHPHAYGCEIEVISLLQENAGDDGQKHH